VDNSPLRHVLLYKNKGIIDLGNLRIQRVHYESTYNNNYEITCNRNPAFVDIVSNRMSVQILPKKVVTTISRCFEYFLHVLLRTENNELEDLFVVSRLNLVSKMSVLSL